MKSYHEQDDVIGFCGDYRHPYGCQDIHPCFFCGRIVPDDECPWGCRLRNGPVPDGT
jgi:hypothetical protein